MKSHEQPFDGYFVSIIVHYCFIVIVIQIKSLKRAMIGVAITVFARLPSFSLPFYKNIITHLKRIEIRFYIYI